MCSVIARGRSTPALSVRTWQTHRCSRVNSAKRRAPSAVQKGTDTHGATCDHARRPVRTRAWPRLAERRQSRRVRQATLEGFCSLALEAHWRRIWHPPGETANPARTQNVRAPCNSGGNSCLKFHRRGRSTASPAGCAASNRSTSSLPRSARGLRRPRAPRIRRAGTMMGARCQPGELREKPNEFQALPSGIAVAVIALMGTFLLLTSPVPAPGAALRCVAPPGNDAVDV